MGAVRKSALAILAALVLAAPASAVPTGSTVLVSHRDGFGPAPAALDGPGGGPAALSDDGRYAVFGSAAPFAAGGGAQYNEFLRDTQTGATTLVSRSDGAAGAAANTGVDSFSTAAVAVEPAGVAPDPPHDQPHVLVAFVSKATNLVDHFDSIGGGGPAATGGLSEVWLRDVTAGTTYLISRAVGKTGAPANATSAHPSLAITDHDGPVIAFSSLATNLGVNPGVPASNVYLRTLYSGGTQQVSCHAQSCPNPASGGFSANPSVRFVPASAPHPTTVCPTGFGCVLVAFSTDDSTISGDPAANSQIVVANATETIGINAFNSFTTASKADGSATTLGNDLSQDPALSPDGLVVGFFSRATNLGASPPVGSAEVFTRTLDGSGITTLVSRGTGNTIADGEAFDVSLSGDAAHRRVAFTASASNFGVPDPTSGSPRAWVRDLSTGTTELLDRQAGATGAPGDGLSSQVGISADGTKVAFTSSSHNLDAGGGSDFNRVYVRHLDTEALDLVSRPDGTGPFLAGVRDSTIGRSAVSADGRFVAFQSNTDNLAGGEDNRFRGVFVRDLLTGTTILVSRANGAAGAAADASATLGGISDNGRRVLFNTEADNLIPGPPVDHAYVRDLDAGTTTVVTRANGPTGTITDGNGTALSGDGNSVAFITRAVLDPDASAGLQHVYVRNLAAQTTTFVDRDNGPTGSTAFANADDAVIDRDGGRVAWTTPAGLAGTSGTGSFDRLYERDLRAGTTTLVGRAEGANGAMANAAVSNPAINAGGDVVAFQSAATNLGAPVTADAVWVRDLAQQHTQLASRASGATGSAADRAASVPSLDAAGDRVAFRSAAGNLGAGPQASANDLQAYVRDVPSQNTELASRANGAAGGPIDSPGFGHVSLSASGDCVAFDATGLNIGDGFASGQFPAVHLRVLRHECAVAQSVGAPPPGTGKAPSVPVLSGLKLVPNRFAVVPAKKPKKSKRRRHTPAGTSIRFTLNLAANVKFVITRQTIGRRSGHRCVPARGRIPRRKRCTRVIKAGSFTARGVAKGNRIRFTGRLGRRALSPGRYRLTATPVDPRRRRVRSHSVAFTIIR
ncbi:MAG: TolB family protein [Solirubrobacteraceae bacterium]